MQTLGVVVPATDGRSTARCVEAIRTAAEPPQEIIVVAQPPQLGPAAARNEGVHRTDAAVIVFVDSDIEVHADAFQRIRAAFEQNPDLAAVFGAYDDDPVAGGLVSDFRNLLHHHIHASAAGTATTFWAGLGAIRRDEFLAVGGFTEQLFPHASIEDIELGSRLASRGKLILLDPGIQGKHLKRWTLWSMMRTDLLRRGVPWVRLLLRGSADPTALNLDWRHRASALATLAFLGASWARKRGLAGASLGALFLLNREFYGLLYSKRGFAQVAAGVPLHMLHHLVAVASVPVGVAQHVASDRREPFTTG